MKTVPFLVKGLSLKERDVKLTQTLKGWSSYFETDHTRFDRHISLPIIDQVQDVLFRLSSRDHLFRQCLAHARNTKGSSDLGVKYSVQGTRCSGDAHTSIGNGFINAVTTYICMRHIRRDLWTSIHEGDDGVIASNCRNESLRGLDLMSVMGFTIKCDTYNQIDDVSFCGRQLFEGDLISSHADVLRSLDKFGTTVSNMKAQSLIYAKSLSYNFTDSDTPLIGPLTYAICKVLESKTSFSQAKRGMYFINRQRWMVDVKADSRAKKPNITWQARVSVARRTGIPPYHQIWLEKHYELMITRDCCLEVPKIAAEWFTKEDAQVFGDPCRFNR